MNEPTRESAPARVSAVIPTYNRAEMACRCVESVLASEWPDVEAIVVDDCSPDATAEKIAERFGDRVRCIRNARNSFQAVSRNNGARIATGGYLLFLDDDNILDPKAIPELVRAFEADPRLGLAAPVAIHRRPGLENAVWSLGSDFNRWTSQPRDRCPNLPADRLPAMRKSYPTSYYPNGFMVPRAVYDAVGGFDEKYVQIFEESDFGWLVREAGYECIVLTSARTEHLGFLEPGCTPELRRLGIEKPYRTYCFARNRLRFARKHFSALQALSVSLVFAPLSALYYGAAALRRRRPDIAWAYLKGTVRGILGLD